MGILSGPRPSCPSAPLPHAKSRPQRVTASVCHPPQATCATGEGSDSVFAEPGGRMSSALPGCLDRQHWLQSSNPQVISWSPTTAAVCATPQENRRICRCERIGACWRHASRTDPASGRQRRKAVLSALHRRDSDQNPRWASTSSSSSTGRAVRSGTGSTAGTSIGGCGSSLRVVASGRFIDRFTHDG